MNELDENIKAFLRVLDSGDNSTGGGTASAVAGSMAAALVAMVARLSVGKPGLESESFYKEIMAEAEALSTRLFAGGKMDADAFDGVQEAMRMSRNSDREKEIRKKAIATAMLKCTHVPLSNAESCRRVLDLGRKLKGCFNPNAASDLECAEHLAEAGLKGCLANVAINLPGIKDPDQAARIGSQAEKLINRE